MLAEPIARRARSYKAGFVGARSARDRCRKSRQALRPPETLRGPL